MEAFTPTRARKNFYQIIKSVNVDSKPVEIIPTNGEKDKSAVMISKKDWDAIEETLGLVQGGILKTIQERKDDDEIDITDGIDWDKI